MRSRHERCHRLRLSRQHNKHLTVIWNCQPQRFVLSEVVISSLKVRMDGIAGPQIVPRTISILEVRRASAVRLGLLTPHPSRRTASRCSSG